MWGLGIFWLFFSECRNLWESENLSALFFYFTAGLFLGLVFIIGGFCFIGWYRKNRKYTVKIPDSFIPLSQADYPKLFELVAETSAEVGVPLPESVYLEEGTTTAVFVSAENNHSRPELSLVIGLALVSQMSDEELRAVLLHEFGHFSQEALKSTYSVYKYGQLSRMQLQFFPELFNEDLSLGSMKKAVAASFIATYTAYRLRFLRKIKNSVRGLSEFLEYEADDVAVCHVDFRVLQRTLLHASEIEHAWNVIEWGLGILRENDDVVIDNPYLVLSLLGREDFTYSSLPPMIQRRIERLGPMGEDPGIPPVSEIQTRTMEKYFELLSRKGTSVRAEDFYSWG